MESLHADVPIMLRVHNSCRYLQDTLDMISNQSVPTKVYAFACEPSPETRAILDPYVEHIYTISQLTYDAWQFLNRCMEMVEEELIVFLDADCTPVDVHWLVKLIEPCRKEQAGAAFSRKLPRSDAGPLIMNDLTASFGEHGKLLIANNRHAFSIESMVFRRSVWEEDRFPENLGKWAPFVWTWNARRRGVKVVYSKYSRILFIEPYTLRYWYKKTFDEGKVEAQVFSWDPKEKTRRSYFLKPWRRQVAEDWRMAVNQRKISGVLYSPVLRFVQYLGKYRGFRRTYKRRP